MKNHFLPIACRYNIQDVRYMNCRETGNHLLRMRTSSQRFFLCSGHESKMQNDHR